MRAFLLAAPARDLYAEFPTLDLFKMPDAANASFQLWDTQDAQKIMRYNETAQTPITIVPNVRDLPRFFLARSLLVWNSATVFEPQSFLAAQTTATQWRASRVTDMTAGRWFVVKRGGVRVCIQKSAYDSNTDRLVREFCEPSHRWAGVDVLNLEFGADDD